MNGDRGVATIVGGGVVGTACAYYLAKAGWSPVIVERGKVGAGCSHGNCGYISPSHVLPLAGPGAVGATLKAMLSAKSPFYIRPRLDPALWSWLFRFWRRCNERDMLAAGRAIGALLESSAALYRGLIADEPLDCEFETRGLLFVFHTQAELEHYAHTDKLLRERFEMPAVRYDADALVRLEPALKPGAAAGAWHYPGDAHLRPDKLLAAWRRANERWGVKIVENCEVTGIVREAGRFRALRTSQGEIAGAACVVAAGAWTPLLRRELGCRIPIQPGKGYSITMPRPARCPTIPMIFHEHRVAITPMQSAYRIGSTMEFAGYDATLSRRRLALLTDAARLFLHEPTAAPVQEEWFGWRPMTYDSLPIVGPVPATPNLYIAAGHGMLGVSMATGTGKLIGELVSGARPHVDPAPYAATRF